MNFDFSEEQQLMREHAQRFLAERSSLSVVRTALENPAESTHNVELWHDIAELGWTATTIPEHYGGAGLGYLELCVLAEELGRALTPLPFASSVYLATEAVLASDDETLKQHYLPKLASGELIGTLAFAEKTGFPTPASIETTFSSGRINGVKQPVPDALVADFAIVIARSSESRDRDEAAIRLCLVDLNGEGVIRENLSALDPTRSLASLRFENTPVKLLNSSVSGWQLLQQLLDRAAILLAFEQLGGAQAALDMAKQYALERHAFARPIASFQAIKHKLADMYIAVELARSNCYFGAWALSSGASELPVAAATARVSATEAFYLAAKENIQIHGGMGFTWESDCQLYYRRAKALALMLGSSRRWKDILVRRLAARNTPSP